MQPNVLIVDDDLAICQILTRILNRENYQVIEANDGKSAKALFLSQDINAILLDMMLPDADGINIAKEMLRLKPDVPIILISAHGTIAKAVEATKQGIYDFVEKPFESEHIMLRLRNALAYGYSRRQLSYLQSDALRKYRMVGYSPAMQQVYQLIDKIAPTLTPVLITGENGVGKELVAQAIHNAGKRAGGKLIRLNCSAVPDDLFESELFGHTRGAFTGAHVPRRGLILEADKGTLFMDEIGDLSPSAQAKILRFLESGEVQKIGSNEIQTVDARIIAATNRDLEQMTEKGEFRRDLYYRLDVFPIHVPALRERREDIPLLISYFISEFSAKNHTAEPRLSQAAELYLCSYEWPGNVRQLKHIIERLLLLTAVDLIEIQHIKAIFQSKKSITESPQTLKAARLEFERNYILTVLSECDNNATEAAAVLGLDRANLYRKMQQLGINRPQLSSF